MNDANRTVGRRLRRAVAVPAGAVAALILFFLCTAGAAEAVSAEKVCKWRHHTNWADSLDETTSRTFGAISCAPNSGVYTTCHVSILMGQWFDFASTPHRGWCNATAALPVKRAMIINYQATFSFWLELIDTRRRWTQAYVGSSRPNMGCDYDRREGRHTLSCTNVHD